MSLNTGNCATMPPCQELSDIIYGDLGLDFGELDTISCALTMPVGGIMTDNRYYGTLFLTLVTIPSTCIYHL